MSAAYLRLWGLSQEKAAKGAGIGERTLARYEISEWWPKACGEAVDRWMQQLEIECRTTIMAAVKDGDIQTAVKMLERIEKRLAPPKQLHELAADGGGPIETKHVHVYIPDARRATFGSPLHAAPRLRGNLPGARRRTLPHGGG